jgi:uncharacterized protein
MDLSILHLWYLLPLGVIIATLAMSSGISASNFTVPLFVLVLGLPPKVAFWLALLSMMFGFGSGAIRNYRAGTVEWYLVGRYATFSAPAGVVGAILSNYAPQNFLLAVFAGFVFIYGIVVIIRFFRNADDSTPPHDDIYLAASGVAGFLHGLIATGMGKFMVAVCLHHRRCSQPAMAVGTAVVTVLIVNTCTFVARINSDLLHVLAANPASIASIAVWLIPGVLIGGQVGPRLAARLSRRHLQVYSGMLLIVVAVLIAVRVSANYAALR